MATLETIFPVRSTGERKRRLQRRLPSPAERGLAGLLHEVDSALERMAEGSYGLCQECHEPVEQDRLLADPSCGGLFRPPNRPGMGRVAADSTRLRGTAQFCRKSACAGGWETSYHYACRSVSGDYCDLIPSDGQLFFVLGTSRARGWPRPC
jgi:sigma-B regulation protein RsbU (phosphoserine phosphatase)